MKNTLLIQFMEKLSVDELDAFGHYLQSPLFNDRESLSKLLQVLRESVLESGTDVSREDIYALTYGDLPFNHGTLKVQFSRLFNQLKDFLVLLELRDDPLLQNRLLLQRVNAYQHSHFSKLHKSARKDLLSSSLNAADLYMEQAWLDEAWDRHQMQQGKRLDRGLMDEGVQHFGISFLTRMLRYRLRQLSFQRTYASQEDTFFEYTCRRYLEEQVEHLPPVVRAYYYSNLALEAPEQDARYDRAQDFLWEMRSEMPPADLRELYFNILNEGVRRINQGQLDYRIRVFDLYREMITMNILQKDGAMPVYHFKNVIGIALRLGYMRWAERFLADWGHQLQGDYAANTFHYNEGLLAFYRADYGRAEQHFNRVLDDYQDIFHGLNARGMLLQIFYETKNLTGLESLLDSYRMFVHRQKQLTKARKQQYIRFINHLRRLATTSPGDQRKLRKLRSDLLEKKPTGIGKEWLLAKIQELKEA